MKKLILIAIIIISKSLVAQSDNADLKSLYKAMQSDNSYNFYEVVEVAERYFNSIDKYAKGSGYKPYMRWKEANEYKYYPSGDRSKVDPLFVEKEFQAFLKNKQQSGLKASSTWQSLGPYTIDSITGHYSTGLGRMEDLYVSPLDSNIIYVSSRSGGFWKSNDEGQSWTVTTDFLPATGVNVFAVSPTNSDSILINVQNARNTTSHGIYRSTDGGSTWSLSNFNPSNIYRGGLGSDFQIYDIRYHPRIKDLIFVGTSEGLYRSTDNLQSWAKTQTSLDVTQITFHPSNDSIIYFYDTYYWSSDHDRIYRSSDLGVSFSAINGIEGNNNRRSVRLSVSNDCASCLYYASQNGVWKSIDNGQTFRFLSNPNESCEAFAVNDIDTSVMIYGYVDLEASLNGGKTFSNRTRWSLGNTNGNKSSHATSFATSTNYIHADMRNAKCVNGVFYVSTDGFVCKSADNGSTWTILTQGVGTREAYCLGISQSNHERTISGSQDNGSSIRTEKGWIEYTGGDGMEGIIHPLNDDWMISSYQFGSRTRTSNGGSNLSGANPIGVSGGYWVAPLAYDPNNHMRFYDFRDSIYRTDDFGISHTYIGQPNFSGDIQVAAIAENNSNIIVVARNEFIEKSTDGGVTFTSIKAGLPSYSIRDISFNPKDDDNIFVVYGRYQNDGKKVYMTTNGGQTWQNITYNLGNMPISSVVIDHSSSSTIYLGAEIGVYTKPLSGNTWSLYNTGLPNMDARELEINYGSNTIRTATWGRGLWEASLVGRANYPSIVYTQISDKPTESTPKESVNQFVSSIINYTGTLSSVYVAWSKDTAVFGNTIPMTNTQGSEWVSSQALPNFVSGTKMYFKVFAVGTNQDTTETYKFMYEVKDFKHCLGIGNNSSGNLYINRVSIENINNFSANNSYSLYSNPMLTLYKDSTYSIQVTASTGWGSNDFGAWIDYNGNKDFEDQERIFFKPNSGAGVINSFTVPSTIAVGDTVVMRVRLSYWNDPEPCGNAFGEVEDYLLVLKDNTTGINENEVVGEHFRFYPNPTDGQFTIAFKEGIQNQQIKIYSSHGKLIQQSNQGKQSLVQFNLDLPAGTYFVSVGSGKQIQTLPLVITK